MSNDSLTRTSPSNQTGASSAATSCSGAIHRPALRYYGGKWKLATWIISHFPIHDNYVEPCGGAASVLIRKRPSKLETYNDLDGEVVNFFRVVRDQPEAFIEALMFTPWSREEYERALSGGNWELDRARAFWCRSMMTVAANPQTATAADWRTHGRCQSGLPATGGGTIQGGT